MKKISIFTFCNNMWHVNYGQVLQCYAMQEICKKLGFETQVVRYRAKNKQDIIKFKFPFGIMNKIYEDYCQRKFITNDYNNSVIKFQKFMKRNVNLTYPCYNTKDIEAVTKSSTYLICGSDQIWNPNSINDVYGLNFGNKAQRRIAYAASGIIPKNTYSDKKYKELSEYLKNFTSIALREKSSIDILKEYTTKEIEDVMDPTFLLNNKEWDKVSSNYKIDGPYIFCYTLHGIRPYKMILNELKEYYGAKKVVYIQSNVPHDDYPRDFVKILSAGPGEFLTLVKDAVAVCTDSFHGIAFAINYKKQFCVFSAKGRGIFHNSNRQRDILEKLHISDRQCNCLKDIKKLVSIDYDEVEKYLSKEREYSLDFLKKSLNEN